MRLARIAAIVAVLVTAMPVSSQQPTLAFGDVLVSTFVQTGPTSFASQIRVYSSTAVFKGDLASMVNDSFGEPFYRDGSVYAGRTLGIRRIDPATGQQFRFSDLALPTWLSPALDRSIIVATHSGLVGRIGADGSILLFREVFFEPFANGLELAPDQCTVYYATPDRLAIWDVCRNTVPMFFGETRTIGDGRALRLLRDGTFLVAHRLDITRADAAGRIMRTYGIPSQGLALDVGGTAFWAGDGSTLLKIDIETGAILASAILTGSPEIRFLGVVGEPRAALAGTAAAGIPALSSVTLLLLAATLIVIALIKLR